MSSLQSKIVAHIVFGKSLVLYCLFLLLPLFFPNGMKIGMTWDRIFTTFSAINAESDFVFAIIIAIMIGAFFFLHL